MKKILVSVRDCKADFFGVCVAADNEAIAVRQFLDIANDKSTQIGLHPEDFQLYLVGEFSLASGKVTALDAPKFLANASEGVKTNE